MEVVVVLWLLFGGVSAMIASSKGGNGLVGFLVGFLLGPFGVIIAFFMGSKEGQMEKQVAAGEAKICPRCAETVMPAAQVCKHCGHEFASS